MAKSIDPEKPVGTTSKKPAKKAAKAAKKAAQAAKKAAKAAEKAYAYAVIKK
jgi:hypothetical protein